MRRRNFIVLTGLATTTPLLAGCTDDEDDVPEDDGVGEDDAEDDGLGDDNGEDDNGDGDGEDDAPEEASVGFSDQESDDGMTVTVDEAPLPEGGFVAIHDETLISEEDPIGSNVGVSEYFEAGTHSDIEVELDREVDAEGETLIAMPHMDTNDNETYDFVTSEGEDDGPYTDEDDEAVVADAEVTVADDE
ncbi:MAG: hypothetical protein QXG03_06715 [Halalkalicoccus sp.]